MPAILIVKTGTTEPAVVEQHGDYDDWFLRALGPATVAAPFAGEGLPDVAGFDGVLLTGSPLSVRDEAPWMAEVGRWALGLELPVFGVCFGHQIIGEALGGRVERNPLGGEMGTVEVDLTAAGEGDPLFAGLGSRFAVQQTHRDVLVTPPNAERLAGNANTTWQAFRHKNVRCVQFHPELRAPYLRALLEVRGIDALVRDDDVGPAILRNWKALL
jgi:GMP synthase (glutamine-hydrolysing)